MNTPGVSSTTFGSREADGRRHRFQRGEQLVRIILDRRDAMAREQFGEKPHHDFAVLQHVGDAGWRARIVFEHVECLGVDAHDVDAGDMHVDIVRHFLPAHLGTEGGIAEDQIVRHEAGAQDFARTVDVLDEGVQRIDALGQALFQEPPFRAAMMRGMTSNGISRSCASASP